MTSAAAGPAPEHIRLEREGSVGVLVLDRPERLNAWHAPMRAEVVTALRRWGADDDIGAVVVTGSGDRAFSAGQDLAETRSLTGEGAGWWVDEWQRLYSAVRDLTVPVVAALNGVAAGSAFQFALLADVRIAHTGTRLGQPEIRSGLPSPLGLWLLERMVGWSRAVELVLSGRMVEGEEAAALGLVHRLVPHDEVRAAAVATAAELAALPRGAMRINRRLLRDVTEPGFAAALARGHALHAEAYASGEPQQLMQAFLARSRS